MRRHILGAVIATTLAGTVHGNTLGGEPTTQPAADGDELWRGVHLLATDPSEVPAFKQVITEALVPLGCNTIVLEVDYKYEYASHPELRAANALSKENARDLARHCRENGIRLIPQFQCLGHQSWARTTNELPRRPSAATKVGTSYLQHALPTAVVRRRRKDARKSRSSSGVRF